MSYGYIGRKLYEMEIRSEIISSRERQWGLENQRYSQRGWRVDSGDQR